MRNFLLFVFCSLLLASAACEKVREAAPAEEKQAALSESLELVPAISVANIVLTPQSGATVTLTVEVARTTEQRSKGLQERDNLPKDHGMWFVFKEDVQDPFWMKNTPIALDILFFDKDFLLADFVENAEPNSEALVVARKKYRYVLEVNGGSLRQWGLVQGDRAEFRVGPP